MLPKICAINQMNILLLQENHTSLEDGYLFRAEGNKLIQYKESKITEDALIHIGEVFATDINFNERLQLDIHEYRMLCCSL